MFTKYIKNLSPSHSEFYWMINVNDFIKVIKNVDNLIDLINESGNTNRSKIDSLEKVFEDFLDNQVHRESNFIVKRGWFTHYVDKIDNTMTDSDQIKLYIYLSVSGLTDDCILGFSEWQHEFLMRITKELNDLIL